MGGDDRRGVEDLPGGYQKLLNFAVTCGREHMQFSGVCVRLLQSSQPRTLKIVCACSSTLHVLSFGNIGSVPTLFVYVCATSLQYGGGIGCVAGAALTLIDSLVSDCAVYGVLLTVSSSSDMRLQRLLCTRNCCDLK
eukprot:3376659-Pleurochrysis_carterae.AAC.2